MPEPQFGVALCTTFAGPKLRYETTFASNTYSPCAPLTAAQEASLCAALGASISELCFRQRNDGEDEESDSLLRRAPSGPPFRIEVAINGREGSVWEGAQSPRRLVAEAREMIAALRRIITGEMNVLDPPKYPPQGLGKMLSIYPPHLTLHFSICDYSTDVLSSRTVSLGHTPTFPLPPIAATRELVCGIKKRLEGIIAKSAPMNAKENVQVKIRDERAYYISFDCAFSQPLHSWFGGESYGVLREDQMMNAGWLEGLGNEVEMVMRMDLDAWEKGLRMG
jgi:hypothetical protein